LFATLFDFFFFEFFPLDVKNTMSRLIIKNLPAYVTPVRLREHLEQKGGPGGTITDVKVPLKANGASRHFGFVGFKTEKEASAAQAWFNNTFVDSARISVEVIEV
jgi:multiple RNA-binding domain-containing protein 1